MFAVIMCGGSGTRFWPASRKAETEAVPEHYGQRPHGGGDL